MENIKSPCSSQQVQQCSGLKLPTYREFIANFYASYNIAQDRVIEIEAGTIVAVTHEEDVVNCVLQQGLIYDSVHKTVFAIQLPTVTNPEIVSERDQQGFIVRYLMEADPGAIVSTALLPYKATKVICVYPSCADHPTVDKAQLMEDITKRAQEYVRAFGLQSFRSYLVRDVSGSIATIRDIIPGIDVEIYCRQHSPKLRESVDIVIAILDTMVLMDRVGIVSENLRLNDFTLVNDHRVLFTNFEHVFCETHADSAANTVNAFAMGVVIGEVLGLDILFGQYFNFLCQNRQNYQIWRNRILSEQGAADTKQEKLASLRQQYQQRQAEFMASMLNRAFCSFCMKFLPWSGDDYQTLRGELKAAINDMICLLFSLVNDPDLDATNSPQQCAFPTEACVKLRKAFTELLSEIQQRGMPQAIQSAQKLMTSLPVPLPIVQETVAQIPSVDVPFSEVSGDNTLSQKENSEGKVMLNDERHLGPPAPKVPKIVGEDRSPLKGASQHSTFYRNAPLPPQAVVRAISDPVGNLGATPSSFMLLTQ